MNIMKFFKPILQLILILLSGAIIIIGTTVLVNKIREPQVIEKINTIERIVKAPECDSFNDYQSIINKGQFLILAKDRNTYSENGQFINNFNTNVNRSGDSQIACGYLFVKARINGNELSNQYDSVYINPEGFGGHILRSKSLKIENTETNKTNILLPLEAISYLPTVPYNPNAQNYKIANWVNLLNTGDKVNFNIGLSSLDSRGYIDEIIIAYKCWDSITGKETQSCQLSLDK